MKWQQMYSGGEYISAEEIGDQVITGKIRHVESVKVVDDNDRPGTKPAVYFEGNDRGWMLPKVNSACIAAMFGDDVAGWVGKSVTLYTCMVKVGKGQERGIRVKGSPNIPAPVKVTIKQPRRKPFVVTLVPTGKPNGKAAEKSPAAALADAAEEAQDTAAREPGEEG